MGAAQSPGVGHSELEIGLRTAWVQCFGQGRDSPAELLGTVSVAGDDRAEDGAQEHG